MGKGPGEIGKESGVAGGRLLCPAAQSRLFELCPAGEGQDPKIGRSRPES
jgi:hypothetical protein